MEKLNITWEDYNSDIYVLKERINKIENPHLVTLYRGGLPMGTHLSNILATPLSIIDFQSYDAVEDMQEPKLIKNANITAGQTLVLIDDIFDRGLTIAKSVNFLQKEYPNLKLEIFTLYRNNHMNHLHENYDFDVTSLHKSCGLWVEFPWETV